DQVVTDVKLWARDALDGLDRQLHDLQAALLTAAERDRDLFCPVTRTSNVPNRCWRPITSWLMSKNTSATGTGWPPAGGGATCCPWGPRPGQAPRYPSTGTASAGSCTLTPWPPTASTSPATGISCWSLSSICPSLPCTSAVGPRNGFSGPRRSSASSTC